MSDLLATVAGAVAGAFAPLDRALSDPAEMRSLLLSAGRGGPVFTDDVLDDIAAVVGLQSDLATLVDGVDTVLDQADPNEIQTIIDAGTSVVARIRELSDGSLVDSFATAAQGLPAPWDDPQIINDIIVDLADHLVLRWFDEAAPMLVLGGRLLGVVGVVGGRAIDRVDWQALAELFVDPTAAMSQAFNWNAGSGINVTHLERVIRSLADLLWLRVDADRPSGPLADTYWPDGSPRAVRMYTVPLVSESLVVDLDAVTDQLDVGARLEAGLVVMPIPDDDPTKVAGLVLAPQAAVSGKISFDFGDDWVLTVNAPVDLVGDFGVELLPDPDRGIATAVAPGAPALDLSIAFAGEPGWGLGQGVAGIEVGPVAFTLGWRGEGAATEPYFVMDLGDATDPTGPNGLTLKIGDADADGFLSWFMGDGISVGASLKIDASPSGMQVAGGLGLTVSIPIDRAIGPLFVDRIDLGIGAALGSNPGVALTATARGSATLGPIVLVADGLGVSLAGAGAADGDGLLGPIDIGLGFVPPTAFGASVDAGLVQGGGYLEVTPPRYSGILDIDILGVGVTVIGVVSTESATGGTGFSLFLSILTEFTPIPLAFGFTLNGVGGIAAINRTMDIEALADGVLAGDLDHILYPDDPIGDAAQILDSIDAWFPEADGQSVFGPVVQIGWGVPTLVTIDLGVFIAFPEVSISVVGEVKTALPTEEIALLSIEASLMGGVDVAAGTVIAVGAITNAQVVGIRMSGSIGFYMDTGSSPFFMLSVGGTHPDWIAPTGVPSSMTDLDELSATIPLALGVSAQVAGYFAVTSNSVQFGGGIWLSASTKFLFTTYYAEGWFDTDVLMTFTPLHFSARLQARICVRTNKKTLFGVTFTVTFEGPDPWYASGGATFEFFGIDVTFPIEVGRRAGSLVPKAYPVSDDLAAALAHPDSWMAVGSAAGTGVFLSQAALDRGVTTPNSTIEVRQQVVPFGIDIERYGALLVEGETRFDIAGAGVEGARTAANDWEILSDYFAPAVYVNITERDKLSGPSFEQYDAGVRFGGSILVPKESLTIAIAHEEREVEGDAPTAQVPLRDQRLDWSVQPLRQPLGSSRKVTTTRLTVVPRSFVAQSVTGDLLASGLFVDAATARPADTIKAEAVANAGQARSIVVKTSAVIS